MERERIWKSFPFVEWYVASPFSLSLNFSLSPVNTANSSHTRIAEQNPISYSALIDWNLPPTGNHTHLIQFWLCFCFCFCFSFQTTIKSKESVSPPIGVSVVIDNWYPIVLSTASQLQNQLSLLGFVRAMIESFGRWKNFTKQFIYDKGPGRSIRA